MKPHSVLKLVLQRSRFRPVSSFTMAGTSRVDEWISFVGRCKSFGATAKTFEVPRGDVTVTDSLKQIFPTRSSDDVMQMMTVLQWFFGSEYLWFIAVRLGDKAKFAALCKNGKYPKFAASEVASKYSESAAVLRRRRV